MEQAERKDPQEIRDQILSMLRFKGPSLPVHVSGKVGLSMLFAGAFLSELASDKSLKISNMKVGGSPLYYLQGQEAQLEKFYTYLPGKEKEAFLLLKQNKILRDNEQEPAIRVALRQLKDFALPFKFNNIVFWRFHTITEEEIRNIFSKPLQPKPIERPKIETKPVVKEEPLIEKPILKAPLIKKEPLKIIEKPIIKDEPLIEEKASEIIAKPIIKEEPLIEEKAPTGVPPNSELGGKKPKIKEKPKSDFVNEIINFLSTQDMEVLEEKEVKKKEYQAIIRLDTNLGKMRFLCIAKDKKRITDNDFALSIQKSQSVNMPALFISPGEPTKKAQEYLKETGLVLFKKI